jgi:transcriptional regulator with XRE-family HTH domain
MSMQPLESQEIQTGRRIDQHIGSRLRLRRTLLGMTQEQLAAVLGISYQQVQKYETGANRISASRLFEIGQMLETDASYFYEGLSEGAEVRELPHGGHNRVAIDLVRNFLEIADENQRTALAMLVKTLKPAVCGTAPISSGQPVESPCS